MNKKQKLINQKKKRIVIITACILALILIFAIISLATFGFKKIKEGLIAKETNILYYNEEDKQNEEEENNVIVVGIDEKNETNENVNNENTETNNTKVETKPETPKKQEIPYYIKVNNTANVVLYIKKIQMVNIRFQ